MGYIYIVEAERQNKLSLHSTKTLLFPIVCLHWKSASRTLTLIPINVPLRLSICNINQLVYLCDLIFVTLINWC